MHIKVMADYESMPLWSGSEDGLENLSPYELAISSELASGLIEWSRRYDATLNRSDPTSSGFKSKMDRDQFVEDGLQLANSLASELGRGHIIEYFDERSGTVLQILPNGEPGSNGQ